MLRQAQQPKTDNQFILQFNFDHLLITKLDGHKDVEIRQRKGQQMVLELNAVSCCLVQFGHPIIESVRFLIALGVMQILCLG